MMAALREKEPETIGGVAVTEVRDYRSGLARNTKTGETETIHLPKSNVLEFLLGDRGSVIARPSGTEPKVKFYYTAVGATAAEAEQLLAAMKAQMAQ